MDTHILAYLAGVIDSDGCITIVRHRGRKTQSFGYSLRIIVEQTNRLAIDIFSKMFGGSVGIMDNPKHLSKNGKPKFTWYRSSNKAAECIRALLPYLRIKHPQAEIALEYRDYMSHPGEMEGYDGIYYSRGKQIQRRFYRLTKAELDRRTDFVIRIRALNDSRSSPTKFF